MSLSLFSAPDIQAAPPDSGSFLEPESFFQICKPSKCDCDKQLDSQRDLGIGTFSVTNPNF